MAAVLRARVDARHSPPARKSRTSSAEAPSRVAPRLWRKIGELDQISTVGLHRPLRQTLLQTERAQVLGEC